MFSRRRVMIAWRAAVGPRSPVLCLVRHPRRPSADATIHARLSARGLLVRGTRKPLYWWLLTSRQWTPPQAINVYVIEHARGLILFDTGQDRASVTDGDYFPGGFTGLIYSRLARFD